MSNPRRPKVKNTYTVKELNKLVDSKIPPEYDPNKPQPGKPDIFSLFGGKKNGKNI